MSRRLREVYSFDFSFATSNSSASSGASGGSDGSAAYVPFKQRLARSISRGLSFHTCQKFSLEDLADDLEEQRVAPAPVPSFLNIDLLQIGPQFASGSSGNLYHAIYDDQTVAVKLFHESSERFQEELSACQFLQEIATLSILKHPNILAFVGAYWEGRMKCIVTEYMAGGSLYRFLRKRQRPLAFGHILKLAHEIASGMNYLHKKGIMHRDLKSENILFDANGTVKVMDFGISKFARPGDTQMTAETGTYRWMAPEVIQGKPYGYSVDVYSYGIVLWELLTRKQPFSELTPMQAVFAVVHKNLRPEIPSECPKAFKDLTERCWSPEPETRPTFAEILLQLKNIKADYESLEDPFNSVQ